jgi:hypothetical protein
MTRRLRITAIGFLVATVLIFVVVAQFVAVRDDPREESQRELSTSDDSAAASDDPDDIAQAIASSAFATSTETATLPPVATPLITPTIDVNRFEAEALDFTREQVGMLSGQPEVVFSQTMSPDELLSVGLYAGVYEPGCDIKFHVVVVKGDVDVRGTFPAPVAHDVVIPARYIAYLYDLKADGSLAHFMTSDDGARFKALLGDPTLPDLVTPIVPPTNDPPYPCEPFVAPGVTEEQLDAMATQTAIP